VSNSMFRFNIANNNWSCRYGCTTHGVYPDSYPYDSTFTFDSSNHQIPNRRFHSMTLDSAGNIWIFGGQPISSADVNTDLWRFEPGSGLFFFMGGLFGNSYWGATTYSSSFYGIQGTFGAPPSGGSINGNIPPPRMMHSAVMDKNDVMWVYGGWWEDMTGYMESQSNPSHYYLNDLWAYDTTAGQWAWMSGNSQQFLPYGSAAQRGHLGPLSDTTNRPDPQLAHSAVFANEDDAFYVIAGVLMRPGADGYIQENGDTCTDNCYWGPSNQIWKYNTTSNLWKFESGSIRDSSNDDSVGSWGTLGMRDASNILPRSGGQIAVFDGQRSVYVFGGGTFGTSNDQSPDTTPPSKLLNNLWKLDWDTCDPAKDQYDCTPCPVSEPDCLNCGCKFSALWTQLQDIGFNQWDNQVTRPY